MAQTRGQLLDRVQAMTGDDSTACRTFIETSLDHMLFALFDMHDWEFKHKSGTFNTVAGTESYDLSVSSSDIRSAQDLEVFYDKTNGKFLEKVDLRDIRKRFPKEDTSGKPTIYAPWGPKTVYLSDEPDAIYVMKYLYLAKATLPTADANDLFTTCGLPDYIQYLFEKMVLAEGMLYHDDNRRTAMLTEITQLWLPNAIQADMKHLESGARFKFWEEELAASGGTFDDFLRREWSNSH